jgi:hypothetical protein
VLGSSGKGKTTMIVDRLINRVYRGQLDKIYLISASAHYASAYRRLQGNVTKIEFYKPSLISNILARERKKHNNNRRVCWIFDDIGGMGMDITLRPGDPFVKLTAISRHIGIENDPSLGHVVIFACQCLSMCPTVFRKNCDKVAMFHEDNPTELRFISNNFAFCKQPHFEAFMHDNIKKPHDFLYLSKDNGFPTWWRNMTLSLQANVDLIRDMERHKKKRLTSDIINDPSFEITKRQKPHK